MGRGHWDVGRHGGRQNLLAEAIMTRVRPSWAAAQRDIRRPVGIGNNRALPTTGQRDGGGTEIHGPPTTAA